MDDRTRLAAYLAGLVAVFGLAWSLGNILGPQEGPAPVPSDHTGHTGAPRESGTH